MRIKLKKGKQRELINKVKSNYRWKELSKILGISEGYLRNELKNEERTLSYKIFKKLCRLSNKDYSSHIVNRFKDNWGKSKGGKNSRGSKIKLSSPKLDENLAEFIGIILGDGNIHSYKRGKKVRVYQVRIAGDYRLDKKYHLDYIKELCSKIFNLKLKEVVNKKSNERFLVIYSKELIEFFKKMGLKSGNKIKNKSTIPSWVRENKVFLRSCIRGLIDTDGSIHRMSNKDPQLMRIGFTNHNKKLLNDTRNSFVSLGFNPSKIICNRQFRLSRKREIERYVEEIGFNNPKHLDRMQKFKSRSVVVKFSQNKVGKD